MFKLLPVLFLVLASEAASFILEGSGVANSISDTEIDVSWAAIPNPGSIKSNYVTARLLGGGGVLARETVSGSATRCTLRGLLPGYYYSVYLQPLYATGQLGDSVRIGTYKTLEASGPPATTILGVTCGVVAALCLILGVVIIVLRRQRKTQTLDRNLAQAPRRDSTPSMPDVKVLPETPEPRLQAN